MIKYFRFAYNIYIKIYYKFKYKKSFLVNGNLKKRLDTQIAILEKGNLHLGENVSFQRNVSLSSVGGNLSIGNNVAFNRNCIVVCRNNITISDGVIFGPNVTIYDHDHVYSKRGIKSGYKLGDVKIGEGCWIAANVIILRDTNIGEGCVIGAGAVVKGEIPPHSLVKGNREFQILPIKN